MNNEEIYIKATKKIKAKKKFFGHFIAYIGVLALLSSIMYLENNGEMLAVIIVALSWGIGLASHYFSVFGTEHMEGLGFSPDWEEEELEKEVEKLTRYRELKEQLVEERTLINDLEKLELKEIEKSTLYRDID